MTIEYSRLICRHADEFIQGHYIQPSIAPCGNDCWKRGCDSIKVVGAAIRADAVMHHDDVACANRARQSSDDARPADWKQTIKRAPRPCHGRVAIPARRARDVKCLKTHGRAKEGGPFAGDLFDDVVRPLQFVQPVLITPQCTKRSVLETMIAEDVTFINDSAQHIGMVLSVLADDEKRCRHIVFVQDLENARRRYRIGSIVKRHSNPRGIIGRTAHNDRPADLTARHEHSSAEHPRRRRADRARSDG